MSKFNIPFRDILRPRLWQEFIDAILVDEMGFTQTTHEKCIYHANINGNKILILRQVDDISIASPNKETADKILQIQSSLFLIIV